VRAGHVYLLFDHIVNGDRDVGAERDQVAEIVVPVGEDGHSVEMACVGTHQRNGQHIGRVQHQLRGVAVVAMVVHRAIEQH